MSPAVGHEREIARLPRRERKGPCRSRRRRSAYRRQRCQARRCRLSQLRTFRRNPFWMSEPWLAAPAFHACRKNLKLNPVRDFTDAQLFFEHILADAMPPGQPLAAWVAIQNVEIV